MAWAYSNDIYFISDFNVSAYNVVYIYGMMALSAWAFIRLIH